MGKVTLIIEAIKTVASIYKEIKKMYLLWKSKRITKQIEKRKDILTEMSKVSKDGASIENDEKLKKLLRKLHDIDATE